MAGPIPEANGRGRSARDTLQRSRFSFGLSWSIELQSDDREQDNQATDFEFHWFRKERGSWRASRRRK